MFPTNGTFTTPGYSMNWNAELENEVAELRAERVKLFQRLEKAELKNEKT